MSTTRSPIEWTDATWNPTRGCSLVSPGCTNCYAMRQAARFAGPGGAYEGLVRATNRGPVWTGDVRTVPGALDEPRRWRAPRRVFVDSMSDLFHEHLDRDFIASVWDVMRACPQHTFQVLTKRPARAAMILRDVAPLPNVWLGASVENQATADERLPYLLATPAAVRFLSCEPVLEPVALRLPRTWGRNSDGSWGCNACCNGDRCDDPSHVDRSRCGACHGSGVVASLDWVIVGGESGPGARPCDLAWLRSIVAQCRVARVPVFCKQTGSVLARSLGLVDRKGGDVAEGAFPADLNVREFPEAGRG